MITVTRGQWFPLTLGDIMYNGAAVDLSKCTDITVNLVSGLGMKTGLHVEASGYNEVSCYQEGTMAAGDYKVELTYKDEQGRAYRMCTPRALVRISEGTTQSSGGWEHVGGDGWELTADVEMREALAKTYMSLLEEARQNALKVQKNSNVSFAGTINASAKTKEDVGLKDMADGEVNIYVIADNGATSGGYVTFGDACKGLFANMLGATIGASRGDLLLVTQRGGAKVAKVLPLNDAKVENEYNGFPGADGLETVWDKTQINKIPGLQNSVAGIENREGKTRGGSNMNDNLQTGFYPYCTLGRPSGSGDGCWYTLRTWRSKDADNNGYYTVEQVAVARGGNYLGRVFYRIIFVKDDRTGDNFGDWVEISKTNTHTYQEALYPVIDVKKEDGDNPNFTITIRSLYDDISATDVDIIGVSVNSTLDKDRRFSVAKMGNYVSISFKTGWVNHILFYNSFPEAVRLCIKCYKKCDTDEGAWFKGKPYSLIATFEYHDPDELGNFEA